MNIDMSHEYTELSHEYTELAMNTSSPGFDWVFQASIHKCNAVSRILKGGVRVACLLGWSGGNPPQDY